MVETSTEYSEEFFVDDCYYVLYVSEISKDVKYHHNPRTGDTIDEVLSEESDEYDLCYTISNIYIDKGNDNIEDIDDEKLKKLLFRNIAQEYINTKNKLYIGYNLNETTESFEVSLTHKGEEYLVEFQRE